MSDPDPVPDQRPDRPPVGRRTVLRGVAAFGGAAIVAGCGSDSDTSAGATPDGPIELGPAADVPLGGGAIYDGPQVVVTQPAEGEFKAFSSICTHAGCPVSTVTETINCDCHGSRYSLEDGSVVAGPASNPLPAKKVSVQGADLVVE